MRLQQENIFGEFKQFLKRLLIIFACLNLSLCLLNRNDMKIVADEKIPFLREALETMGHNVVAMPGTAISAHDVVDADALFVRTRTACNEALLRGSGVRFIGTATIGYDHIDAEYCAAGGVKWASAAGCNSGAVLQYVQSALYLWARDRGRSLAGHSIGIVGVGEIGSKVAAWAKSEGMTVLLNDPPREKREGNGGFVSLAEIAEKCDIVTFHPTLSRGGEFPSYHLAGGEFFASLKHCALLINASRGPVVDNIALLEALENGSVADAVLDVWEGEPEINKFLLNKVYIATPHIAGYSAEGKINATRIVLEAFADFFACRGALPLPALPEPVQPIVEAGSLAEALLSIYSPDSESKKLKAFPESFEEQRNNYCFRREPEAFVIKLQK